MKKISLLFIGLLLCILGSLPFHQETAFASDTDRREAKSQIIFLLDASKSMERENRWLDAADCVCMVAAFAPENCEIALLVYNEAVIYQEDFGSIDQTTRHSLEGIGLGGYTDPAAALETAQAMFTSGVSEKRIVFISDGEISMREEAATQEAEQAFVQSAETALENGIKIDMFVLPDENTENKVSYGTGLTAGELYTTGEDQTPEDIAVKYLFDLLRTERIDLGEARTKKGKISVDLQDIYMQHAKILLVSDGRLQDFHVVGQCKELGTVQGNKFAAADLLNPMERQISIDYVLEERANIHAYLVKEYALSAQIKPAYTSETGNFQIQVTVLNHEHKPVLDAEELKEQITILLDGTNVRYRVEQNMAVVSYQTAKSKHAELEVKAKGSGTIFHTSQMSGRVELTVPVIEEEPDYTVLWIVVAVLGAVLLLLTVLYCRKKQKKKSASSKNAAGAKNTGISEIISYDFSGQVTMYLLRGEREDDLPPCSVRLFGMVHKNMPFAWLKDQCGIDYELSGADEIRFSGGKDNTLCFKNFGCATIMKNESILRREKKYSLSYGEKILLIFNEGKTEIELHYKNIKPGER